MQMTSSLFVCQPRLLVADLGGPGANLLMGLASVMLLRRLRPGSIVHLITLLSAGFNLFWLAGCLFEAAVAGQGDLKYAERLVDGAQVMVRVSFGIAATVIGVATCRLLGRQHVSRKLYWLAYAAAGATACASVLFSPHPLGPPLREAAFESLGSMVWLMLVRPRPEGPPPDRPSVADSSPRLVALAMVAFALLLALGHGIDTRAGHRPDRPPHSVTADGVATHLFGISTRRGLQTSCAGLQAGAVLGLFRSKAFG
jgi:hypothetical protein